LLHSIHTLIYQRAHVNFWGGGRAPFRNKRTQRTEESRSERRKRLTFKMMMIMAVKLQNTLLALAMLLSIASMVYTNKSLMRRPKSDLKLLMEFLSPSVTKSKKRGGLLVGVSRGPEDYWADETAFAEEQEGNYTVGGNVTWNYTQTIFTSKRLHREEVENPQDSFAACLLIKDDNHRLPEWLGEYRIAMLRYSLHTSNCSSVSCVSSRTLSLLMSNLVCSIQPIITTRYP